MRMLRVAVVVEEEDLEVEVVSVYGTEFLQVLREAAIALDEDGAGACGCEGRADGSGEAIAHTGKALVGDDALTELLREGLHHDGEGGAGGAGDDKVVGRGEGRKFVGEDVGLR